MISFLIGSITGVLTVLLVHNLSDKEFRKKLMMHLSRLFNENQPNFQIALYEVELLDFTKRLSGFFQTITPTGFVLDKCGWIIVSYAVSTIKFEDFAAAKRAICMEIHTYLLENHGVNTYSSLSLR